MTWTNEQRQELEQMVSEARERMVKNSKVAVEVPKPCKVCGILPGHAWGTGDCGCNESDYDD